MVRIKKFNENQTNNSEQIEAIWNFLRNFTDDSGKKVRFQIKETEDAGIYDGLVIYIYGEFNKE